MIETYFRALDSYLAHFVYKVTPKSILKVMFFLRKRAKNNICRITYVILILTYVKTDKMPEFGIHSQTSASRQFLVAEPLKKLILNLQRLLLGRQPPTWLAAILEIYIHGMFILITKKKTTGTSYSEKKEIPAKSERVKISNKTTKCCANCKHNL